MKNEGSPSLSFSMKEAIWLNRGKRMDELLSLSLEPDIMVYENEEDVTVKGVLQLFGEYRPAEEEEEGDFEEGADEDSLVNRVGFRTIEDVSLSQEGIGEIFHQFPLDVTIPKDRIARLEDVYVHVESFDYHMPQRGYLEIEADLAITGIQAEDEPSPSEINVDDSQTFHEESLDRSFSFEQVRRDLVEDQASEMDDKTNKSFEENDYVYQYENNNDDDFVPEVEHEVFNDLEEYNDTEEYEDRPKEPIVNFHSSVKKDDHSSKDNFPVNSGEAEKSDREEDYDDTKSDVTEVYRKAEMTNYDQMDGSIEELEEVKQPVDVDQTDTKVTVKSDEFEGTDQELFQEDNKNGRHHDEKHVNKTRNENAIHSEDMEELEEVEDEIGRDEEHETGTETEKENENENALYLTKMLTEGTNEAYSKLRMCIVQQGESINDIADRYQIQTSQLMRMNRLKDEQISEGEILYIPVRQSPSSS